MCRSSRGQVSRLLHGEAAQCRPGGGAQGGLRASEFAALALSSRGCHWGEFKNDE